MRETSAGNAAEASRSRTDRRRRYEPTAVYHLRNPCDAEVSTWRRELAPGEPSGARCEDRGVIGFRYCRS